jgi:N-acyl-D-aspartate/D-glutamate deacylase
MLNTATKTIKSLLIPVVAAALIGAAVQTQGSDTPAVEDYDLILLNGTIIDGTGDARFTADIAIKDRTIAKIGKLKGARAADVIDVSGLVVAPGFIDVHNHSDRALRVDPDASLEGYLRQGVTTAVFGVDGNLSSDGLRELIAMSHDQRPALNFMAYIGHNGVRTAAMGMADRKPTAAEMEAMRKAVHKGMVMGAIGLSSGLMYPPGTFATTEEVADLASIVTPFGGKYDSHIRDPANQLVSSIDEAMDIAQTAGIAAHPAHLTVVGQKNFGLSEEVIARIERRRAAGLDVTADVYPYDGAATAEIIQLVFPAPRQHGADLMDEVALLASTGKPDPARRAQAVATLRAYWSALKPHSPAYRAAQQRTENPPVGRYSWVKTVGYQSMRIVNSTNPAFEGRLVTQLADELGITPFALLLRLIVQDGADAIVTLGAIQERDVRKLLLQDWVMISSDGNELTPNHPRSRGTFPRVLGRYVREWNILSLEQAVHKMTGLPGAYLHLSDRGLLREGAIADITVFDPDTVIDHASWTAPQLFSEGILHVLIDGEFAVRNGVLSDARNGRFIPFRK